LICMDDNWPWKNVEKVYAIPWEIVGYKKGIQIGKDYKKFLYDEFRIDERPFNDIYHKMKLENCPVLRKYYPDTR